MTQVDQECNLMALLVLRHGREFFLYLIQRHDVTLILKS
jgi:hypothetical protein